MTAGSGLPGRVWPPVPGKKFVDPAVWPEVDQARQNTGEIGLRIDAVEPAGLNEARHDAPVFGC